MKAATVEHIPPGQGWILADADHMPPLCVTVQALDENGAIVRAQRCLFHGRGLRPFLPRGRFRHRAVPRWLPFIDDLDLLRGRVIAWRPLRPLEELWLEPDD